MVGEQLSYETVEGVLEDAADAGVRMVRFYGGEPLLHRDLPAMVERAIALGMNPYVTTNAALLDQRIDRLVAAGLRDLTIGFYGIGAEYDRYTQRSGLFEVVQRGIEATRARHGKTVRMQMNWLLMRSTANVESFRSAAEFALRHGMTMQIDLIHYSLPYFQEGPARCLQFRPEEDRPMLERVVREIIAVKQERPELIRHTLQGLRSLPDWALLGPEMKVPCSAREMLWVGPDGTVQMCYVTFVLGSLKEKRLREMLFGAAHQQAAVDAFRLNCPNCHCNATDRIMRHLPSRVRYSEA